MEVKIDNGPCKTETRRHFEALLTDISVRVVNLPVEEINGRYRR